MYAVSGPKRSQPEKLRQVFADGLPSLPGVPRFRAVSFVDARLQDAKFAGEVRQLSRVRVAVPNALVVLEVSVEATKRAEALSCGGAQILNMFRRCSRCDDDLMTNLQLRIFTYLHARTCVPRKGQPPCKRQKFELHARIRLGKV